MKGYDIKVTLSGSEPELSRSLILPGGLTFKQLEKILFKVFSFDGYHNSNFKFEYSNDMIYKDKSIFIDEYLKNKDVIYFNYDFGDDWLLVIRVNDIVDYDKSYPTFKSFIGEYNPVEDCGGVFKLNQLINSKKFSNCLSREDREFLRYLRKINPDVIQRNLAKIRVYNFDVFSIKVRYTMNIWRDFLIPKKTSFLELENMISIAFGVSDVSFDLDESFVDEYFEEGERIFSDNYEFVVEFKKIVKHDSDYPCLIRYKGGDDPFDRWYEFYPREEPDFIIKKEEDRSQSCLDDFI